MVLYEKTLKCKACFLCNIIKCIVKFKGQNKIKASNAVYCKSTLIKLLRILQVTNLFSKYTFLIKIIYFCVKAFQQPFELIKTFDNIALKDA